MRKTLQPSVLTALAASLLLAGTASATDVAPYFYTWGYGNPVYPVTSLQDAKAKGIDSLTLAFIINGSSGCQATTDGSTNAITGAMKNDIAAFRQSGGQLILSFGGANGTYLEAACTVDQMVAQIDALIASSGIKTLDFDVEGGAVGNAAANSVRSAALKKLQTKYSDLKISFTLAVAPPVTYGWGTDQGGLTAASLEVVQSAVRAGVKVNRVNLMAMDYGNYYTNGRTDLGQLAIDAATRVREQLRPVFAGYSEAQLWDLIGITPMIGINDVASEIFTVTHAQKVADFAKQKGVGLLSYWALQRDQAGKGDLAIYSGVNTGNFQFWNTFKAVRGGVAVTPTATPTLVPSITPTMAPTVTPTIKPTSTPTVTATPVATSTPVSSACKAWDANTTYLGGECVSFNGQAYKAQWWTKGDSPATSSGVVGTGKVWLPLGTAAVTPTVTATPKPSVVVTPTPLATATPTAKPTVTPTVIPTTAPAACAAWDAGATYLGGECVSLNGATYKALWWTKGDSPATSSGAQGSGKVWLVLGSAPQVTPTATPVATATPKPSVVPTSTPTATITPKPTIVPTVTPTAIVTPKPSVTPIATPAPTAVPTSVPTVTPVPGASGKQVGSYFTQWGIYGRNYTVKHVDTSGAAANLTFINYAFGNIYQKNGGYECGIVNKAEPGASNPNDPQAATGGDAWADYQKGFGAADSVDGVGDAWGWPQWDDPRQGKSGPLKGNFNQLKKLKAKYPHLKVYVSLGGWTWSKWFSKASETDALRKQLVASCIDVYIKGNLPFDSGSNAGGAGVGAGVFDGIDIDWEFPGVIGQPYNTVSAADKQNYTLLLAEFRRQLDAIGAQDGKRYGLTVAIGVGKDKIDMTEPAKYAQYLDWINMMSYDYNGGWAAQGPTDFQSHLYADPASPNYLDSKTGQRSLVSFYNTHDAVTQLLGAGVPASKLVLGVPFYGRGWTGVASGNNGLYQKAGSAAKGTYEAGIEDYKVLKNAPGQVFVHPVTKQSWKFDGSTFWSYDTPEVIQTKVDYAKQHGLGGVFSWSLDGDTSNAELTRAMNKVRQ